MGLCRTSYGIPSGDRGDTPPVTGGDPPPSPAATPSPGLSGITAGPDPEISSSASPPSSPTALSPTLGRGKRQKKVPSVLKDYSHVDHTLFTYWKGDVFLSVLVYVDDLILAGNNSTACSLFKKYLNDCFKLKNLGPLKYFLGIEAARGPRGLFLSQCKYALDILSESGLSASKPAAFPMEQNHGLALAGGPLLSDPGPYRRLIGRLVYLTITRPDICYVVHVLSQFMQSPRSQHWDAALRVLRYLKATPGQGLFLPADSPLQIYAFCDSDWASCPLTWRSITGYFVSLGNSPISWHTKKQPKVSRSSAEVEYRSMAVTTCELTWLKSFLLSLGVHHDRPMRLFCDNQAHYILLRTRSFMKGPSTLRLIVTTLESNYLLATLVPHMFAQHSRSPTSSLKHLGVTSFIIFAAIWAFEISLLQLEGSINRDYSYLQSLTVRLEEWRLKRRDTEEWMRHRQLPEDLKQRVRRFVQYKWLSTRGVHEEAILHGLPADLWQDIQRHMCLDLVRRVPFFSQMDDQLLDAICERLVSSLSTEGTYIVREGDPVSEMLFVIRGRLESSTTNGGRTGFFNSIIMRPGHFCGEE
ncbi:hypothetical protein RJ639_032118 [Escallonia herrerae]|uniref:Cyclic nucleotide-binding domain-containing protein n=1 Tax=Escallonia herrerae TaxID=1293975 RepID=A0AA89BEC2_9ASTE|nr:hypothetical protein RJ639_032118 [Escallonia herrerae]